MARTTNDPVSKINLTLPGSVRIALANYVKNAQTNQSNLSESGFVTTLLRRALNLSEIGMQATELEQIDSLWQEIMRYASVQDLALTREAKTALDVLTQAGQISNRSGLKQSVPWFLMALAQNPSRVRRAVLDSNRILIPRIKYTELSKAVADLIHEWTANGLFAETKFEFADPDENVFDAAINLEYALTGKALYLFPFFLTEFRKSWAGVVQYGKHVAVGWIIHRNAPFLSVDRNELKEKGKVLNDNRAKSLRLKFLSELFSHLTSGDNASLHLEDNYLHREIFPLLKSNFQHGVPMEKFAARKFCKIEKNLGEALNNFGQNDVILYDLAWNKDVAMQAEAHPDLVVIHFAHEQDIPVGIGFSLPTLPFMGSEAADGKSVAEMFLDRVRQSVEADTSLAAKLLEDGILLDDLTCSPSSHKK